MTNLADQTTILILAGGRGTRIAVLNPHLPKPMVDVAGQPFLEWVLRANLRQGFRHFLISIGYLPEPIIAWAATRTSLKGENILSHQEAQAMGTGGAIADCLGKVTTPYVVITNGDSLLLTPIIDALPRLNTEKLDGLIFARHMEDTGRYGRLLVENGLLVQFSEKKPGSGLINGGIYAFRTAWLQQKLKLVPASLEIDILPKFLEEGARIGVAETKAPFIDIGIPEMLVQATDFVTTHQEHFT